MSDVPEPHADLERSLTRLVRRVFLPTAGEASRREAGVHLERSAYITLARVADLDGPRLSDVAAALGLEISTTSRHVKRLVAEGYVAATPDPDDARARRYQPTTEGSRVLARVRAARRARLAERLADWDPEDVRHLAAGLDRLVDALEAEEDDR